MEPISVGWATLAIALFTCQARVAKNLEVGYAARRSLLSSERGQRAATSSIRLVPASLGSEASASAVGGEVNSCGSEALSISNSQSHGL